MDSDETAKIDKPIKIVIIILCSVAFLAVVGILLWRYFKIVKSGYGLNCKTDADCKADGPGLYCNNGYCVPDGTITCTTKNTTSNPLIECEIGGITSPNGYISPTGEPAIDSCKICNNIPAYSCGYVTWGSPQITKPGSGFTSSGTYFPEYVVSDNPKYNIKPSGMEVYVKLNNDKVSSVTVIQPGFGYVKGEKLRIYPTSSPSSAPSSTSDDNYCEIIITETPTLYPTGNKLENGTNEYLPPNSEQAYCLPQSNAADCDLNVSDEVVAVDPDTNGTEYVCSCTNPTMFGYNPISGQCNTVYACQESEGKGSLQVFYQEPNNPDSLPTPCNNNGDCAGISDDSICCAKGTEILMSGGSTVGSIYAPESKSTFGMCLSDSKDKITTLTDASNGVYGKTNTGLIPYDGESSPAVDIISSPSGPEIEGNFSGYCTVKWSDLPDAEQRFFDPNQGVCACKGYGTSVNTVLEEGSYTTPPALYCELDSCKPFGTLNTSGATLPFDGGDGSDIYITTGTCSCQPGYIPCGCDEILNSTCNAGMQSQTGGGDETGDFTITNCGVNGVPSCVPDPCAPYGYFKVGEPVGQEVSNSVAAGACVCFEPLEPGPANDVTPSPADGFGNGVDGNGNIVPSCVLSENKTTWLPPDGATQCYHPFCAVDYGGQNTGGGQPTNVVASSFAGSTTYLLCQGKTTACTTPSLTQGTGDVKDLPVERGTCVSKKQEFPGVGKLYYYYEGCEDCACPYCNYIGDDDEVDKKKGINPNCNTISAQTDPRDKHAVVNNLCLNQAGGSCDGDVCTGDGYNQTSYGSGCWDPNSACVWQPVPVNSDEVKVGNIPDQEGVAICVPQTNTPTLAPLSEFIVPTTSTSTSNPEIDNVVDNLNSSDDLKSSGICDTLVQNMPENKNGAWKCVKNLHGTWDIPNSHCFDEFCSMLETQTKDNEKIKAHRCTGFRHQAVCNSVIRKLQINETCCGGGAFLKYSQCSDYEQLIDPDSKFCKNNKKTIKNICNICS